MDKNTPLSELTLGDLIEVLGTLLKVSREQPAPDTVRGIQGIARIFGVSETTAKRIKASGIIDRAVSQSGRVIVTDVKLARELYNDRTHGRRKAGFKPSN